MNFFRSLPALAAGSFFYALSATGYAYCLTHTCDPKKEVCTFDTSACNVGGLPLFWASSVVTWDVQKDGSAKRNISADTLEELVDSAFKRWQNADCGGGLHPSVTLVDLGAVSCAKPEYNQSQPNANVITFHDAPWPYEDGGAQTNTLALTTVFFNPKTGEIYDANVEINSDSVSDFVLQDSGPGGIDLDAVLTHELGHFLGLSHSETHPSATMYTSYDPEMVTLEKDDVEGICASLPPDRLTKDSTQPRHGFSGDCAEPDTGCCSSTIGGKAPAHQALGLWAFALGVCGWLGRSRLRRAARWASAPRR